MRGELPADWAAIRQAVIAEFGGGGETVATRKASQKVVHIEPGRAGLTSEQVRALVRGITASYRQVRSTDASEPAIGAGNASSTFRENNDE